MAKILTMLGLSYEIDSTSRNITIYCDTEISVSDDISLFTDTRLEISESKDYYYDTLITVLGDSDVYLNCDTKLIITNDKTYYYDTSVSLSDTTVTYYYDTSITIVGRNTVYLNVDKFPFTSYEFVVYLYQEEWITTSNTNGYIYLNNDYNIGSLPTITLYINNTYSSTPKIRVYNGSIYKDILLGTSINSSNSPIIISSDERVATKNGTYFLPSHFPRIKENEFFSVEFMNNGVRHGVPTSLYYKTYNATYETIKFRTNVSLKRNIKEIELPKKYYNSPIKSKQLIESEAEIGLDILSITDAIPGMVWGEPWGMVWGADSSVESIGNRILNDSLSGTTYRVELIGINEDDDGIMKFILGNVRFSGNDNSFGDGDLIQDKLTGKGIWLT